MSSNDSIPHYYTRGEIALALNVSTEMVRLNEEKWGLDRCRRTLNRRVVHYLLPEAQRIIDRLNSPDNAGLSCSATSTPEK